MKSTQGGPQTLLGMHAWRQKAHGASDGSGRMRTFASDPETRVRSDDDSRGLASNPTPNPGPAPQPRPAPPPPSPDWETKRRVDDQPTGDGTQATPVRPDPSPPPPPPDRETAVRSDEVSNFLLRLQNPAPPQPMPHTGVRSDEPPAPRPPAPKPERGTFVRRDD